MRNPHMRGFSHGPHGSHGNGSFGTVGLPLTVQNEDLGTANHRPRKSTLLLEDGTWRKAGDKEGRRRSSKKSTDGGTYEYLHDDEDMPVGARNVAVSVEDQSGGWALFYSRGRYVVSSVPFHATVALLIVANAVIIGLETDHEEMADWDWIENMLLLSFTTELALRLFFRGMREFFDRNATDFFWNVFDVLIVFLGIFDFISGKIQSQKEDGGGSFATLFRVIRLMRILRIFRLVKFLKRLYVLAYGFMLATAAVFWVTFLMAVVLYIFSIILVRTVGRTPEEDANHAFLQDHFGDIKLAMGTLFQLAVQPNLIEYHQPMEHRPMLVIFLVLFIIFGSFGMIALLTGVISEAMFEKNILRLEEERIEREILHRAMGQASAEIFDEVEHNENDEATREKLMELVPRICESLDSVGVHYMYHELVRTIDLMDTDGSGTVDKKEFCRGIEQMAEDLRPMLVLELHRDMMAYVKRSVDACQDSMATLIKEQQQSLHSNLAGLSQSLREMESKIMAKGPPANGSALAMDLPGNGEPRRGGAAGAPSSFDATFGRLEKDIRDLQDQVGAVGGRLDELMGGAALQEIAKGLQEVSALQRQLGEGALGPAPRPASLADRVPRQASSGPAGGAASAAAAPELGDSIAGLQGDVRQLQGTIFSLTSRVEEILSDSQSEKLSSQLAELASRQRCQDLESGISVRMVARVGECEFAVKQACGAVAELSDQMRELHGTLSTVASAVQDLGKSRGRGHRANFVSNDSSPGGSVRDRLPGPS